MIVFVRRLQLSAGIPMTSISTYGSIICDINEKSISKSITITSSIPIKNLTLVLAWSDFYLYMHVTAK